MLAKEQRRGQFHNPVRVVAFNTDEGWPVDASEDIARAVMERARAERETLAREVHAFCERIPGKPPGILSRLNS
jgi:hypothetical protein